MIYGLILYKKEIDSYTDKQFLIRLIISVILVTCISNIGLNTIWVSITTGKAFVVLLGTRIIKEVIMLPIQIIVILFIEKMLRKPFNMYIRSEND